MAWFRKRAIQRLPDGKFAIRLADEVRELLAQLVGQMAELLTEQPDDPSLHRLFPTAYVDDPFRDAEYQVVVGDQLRESRHHSYELVAQTARRDVIDEAELSAWMRALNDLRLVLGTRLDVSEDDDMVGLDADFEDPEIQARWLYETLGQLQFEVVDALSDGL